jgi:GNAT superfamily N-acetyltransferase
MEFRLEYVADRLPAGLDPLRAEARGQGYRMLDTLAQEWEDGTQRFGRSGEALLAAHVGDSLAGIGGLTLEPAIPGAMRIRRFYVALAHRHAGVGRALATALLENARGRVVTANAAAGSEAFWVSLGFVPARRDGYTHVLVRCVPHD